MNEPVTESKRIKQDLIRSYQMDAQQRDARMPASWKLRIRTNFLNILLNEKRLSLLEIGAGTGKDSLFFHDHGLKVCSTDLTYNMASLCRDKDLLTCQADLYYLPYPREQFGAIWSMNCLLHVPQVDLPAVLEEIKAVLLPGGFFHWGVYGGFYQESVYEQDHLHPHRFFSFLTDAEIYAIAERLFSIVSFETVALPDDKNGLHFQSLVLQRD